MVDIKIKFEENIINRIIINWIRKIMIENKIETILEKNPNSPMCAQIVIIKLRKKNYIILKLV